MADRTRLTLTDEAAAAVSDALHYYLVASAGNFGAGWEDEDPDDRDTLRYERNLVVAFASRLEAAQRRMATDA